ncbi:CTP synthase [Bacteriovorax sp. BSW11_IV]|uniref:CTP synthase n=1 Tax=Bacteriovorax sp. BSW11_IV TaxID=1353529 RepID=UPI000389FCF0|nr:CTP synthase [Bacteriovorax sp. BSW11_IV]EQC50320.1 CTP synthase [Bacteriovorax sp. BSW11_IV]
MSSKKTNKKYIFITGGVSSSLGKGLAAASIAALLERRGIKINMLKMDPYINVDPGTMSPTQHGEVFVTDDGAETDLDLGHYERFTSLTLSKKSNFTTGQVYLQVIENERHGKYLGKTVQVVPHITDEIKRRIHVASENADLLIGEIGGTVGDIESLPFVESIRQFAHDVGHENVLFVHLVLIPYLEAAGELKSKPAQHSVKELRSQGLFPNIIICRSDRDVDQSILDKISLFCNVPKDNVFQSVDLDSIYKVPLNFYKQGLDQRVAELLGIWAATPNIKDLEKVVYNFENPLREVKIGIVGKYTELVESYKSLDEALKHGAISNQLKLVPIYIDAEDLEDESKVTNILSGVQGILVPGGFGSRGTEGKIRAIRYARENKMPFFGICLGMQLAMIEFTRNVVGLERATSEEFESGGDPVIHYMEGQSKEGAKGGSMRLGAYECNLDKGTLAHSIYGEDLISERHRHRLEVNNFYIDKVVDKGMTISGMNKELGLVEVIEIKDHPFFIACQYHPEFKSRPYSPHPLFKTFVEKADLYGKK